MYIEVDESDTTRSNKTCVDIKETVIDNCDKKLLMKN
jgi:hypothetical protein